MSESEILETQGRAYAQAKKLRSEIASATVTLRETRKWLHSLDGRIDNAHQNANPAVRHREIAALIDEIRNQKADTLERVTGLIGELEVKGAELAELEQEIAKF